MASGLLTAKGLLACGLSLRTRQAACAFARQLDKCLQQCGAPCLQETVQSIEEPLQDLLDGRIRSVEYSGGQIIVDAPRRGRVYLPGSFNPLHEGHK